MKCYSFLFHQWWQNLITREGSIYKFVLNCDELSSKLELFENESKCKVCETEVTSAAIVKRNIRENNIGRTNNGCNIQAASEDNNTNEKDSL